MRVALRAMLLAVAGIASGVLVLRASDMLVDRPPDTRVAEYLAATARGDDTAALRTWELWSCCVERPGLEARRTGLTGELAAARTGQRYTVRWTEWWRTCCEPGIIDDPRNAGRARLLVTATDASGRDHELVFEVWHRGGAWWGDAGGQTRHDWALREVYRSGDRSYWRGEVEPMTAEAAIRSARSLAMVRTERFEVKRVRLDDLRRSVAPGTFTRSAAPDRTVWLVAAIGPVARGMSAPPGPWAVFAIDVDDHIPLGIDFGESGERPPYFDDLVDR